MKHNHQGDSLACWGWMPGGSHQWSMILYFFSLTEDGILHVTLQKKVTAESWSAAIANHELHEVDIDAESRRLMLERFQTEVRVAAPVRCARFPWVHSCIDVVASPSCSHRASLYLLLVLVWSVCTWTVDSITPEMWVLNSRHEACSCHVEVFWMGCWL